jgi:hypothetical protein
MATNTRESGLEILIVNWLVEQNGFKQEVSVGKMEEPLYA